MKYATVLTCAALAATALLAACNKPTTINPPAEPTTVVVPGPAGPTGATGPTGAEGNKGETGRTGNGTTLIVVPPPMPASTASSSYSLTTPRSTP